MQLNVYEVGMTLALLVNVLQAWIVGKILMHEWKTWRGRK